jgi:hypothetical protein
MAAENTSVDFGSRIGDTAGVIWGVLSEQGSLSLTQLAKQVGEPRDMVMLGLGWLAREHKVEVTEEGRKRSVSLRE